MGYAQRPKFNRIWSHFYKKNVSFNNNHRPFMSSFSECTHAEAGCLCALDACVLAAFGNNASSSQKVCVWMGLWGPAPKTHLNNERRGLLNFTLDQSTGKRTPQGFHSVTVTGWGGGFAGTHSTQRGYCEGLLGSSGHLGLKFSQFHN